MNIHVCICQALKYFIRLWNWIKNILKIIFHLYPVNLRRTGKLHVNSLLKKSGKNIILTWLLGLRILLWTNGRPCNNKKLRTTGLVWLYCYRFFPFWHQKNLYKDNSETSHCFTSVHFVFLDCPLSVPASTCEEWGEAPLRPAPQVSSLLCLHPVQKTPPNLHQCEVTDGFRPRPCPWHLPQEPWCE